MVMTETAHSKGMDSTRGQPKVRTARTVDVQSRSGQSKITGHSKRGGSLVSAQARIQPCGIHVRPEEATSSEDTVSNHGVWNAPRWIRDFRPCVMNTHRGNEVGQMKRPKMVPPEPFGQ